MIPPGAFGPAKPMNDAASPGTSRRRAGVEARLRALCAAALRSRARALRDSGAGARLLSRRDRPRGAALCDGQRSRRRYRRRIWRRTIRRRSRSSRATCRRCCRVSPTSGLLRDGPDGHCRRRRCRRQARDRRARLFAGGPAGLLAELTHRCPLQCPYCSNPLELERANAELGAEEWGETFRQAAAMGVLQLHLSGGEPTARRDLDEIVAARRRRRPLHQSRHRGGPADARASGGARRNRPRSCAGLGPGRRCPTTPTASPAIRAASPRSATSRAGRASWASRSPSMRRCTGRIIDHLPEIIEFAVEVGAQRLEVAHIQYYAWAREEPRGADPDPREIPRIDRRSSTRRRRGWRAC